MNSRVKLFFFIQQLKAIVGVLHAYPTSEGNKTYVDLIESKEKSFIIFGMVDLQHSVLVDVNILA